MAGALSTCAPHRTTLDRVLETGVLRVATVNSPTTYFIGPDGPMGYEYDLAQRFAEQLGVRLQIEVVATPPQAIALINGGQVHFAAAGLGITPSRADELRFTRPLQTVVPQVVFRSGTPRPATLDELDAPLTVIADSAHAEQLHALRPQHPTLQLQETAAYDAEQLLAQVAEGELPYAVANSDLIAMNQRYYPQLQVAFPIAESQDLAWAFAGYGDDSLQQAASRFLDDLGSTELARLHDRYFGHVEVVDQINAVALALQTETRLPRYREAFERAGERYGLDWRLLAAIGYQESHWNPAAVSPTGVRGIMQLTLDTAALLNVANREDPDQSIAGGARYFDQILQQLPADIPLPDRYWMALAAYNMGLGHLHDAQRLTALQGGDPTRWYDVRATLPLLTQAKWYKQTRHGYARSYQALHYVANIRSYYDMIAWLTDSAVPADETTEPQNAVPMLADLPVADSPVKVLTPQVPVL